MEGRMMTGRPSGVAFTGATVTWRYAADVVALSERRKIDLLCRAMVVNGRIAGDDYSETGEGDARP